MESGDHENFYADYLLNMTETLILHNNGSFINDHCESKAVRIRAISEQRMWPNLPRQTLLFSSQSKYNTESLLEETGDIDLYDFHYAVNPKYG